MANNDINHYQVTGWVTMRKKFPEFFLIILFFCVCIFLLAGISQASQSLVAVKVKTAPIIDGSGQDKVWSHAKELTVMDKRTNAKISLKTVFTDDMVFFLVQYPDSYEDRLHKPWVWDKELKAYMLGPQREDTFTFKWNMENKEVDISNFSDDSYTADVWYWKANRTDPAGYADDKSHVLASQPGKKAKELTSKTGKKRYLMRLGDEGQPAQKKRILPSYQGDVQDQYEPSLPDGSHADIQAKGIWKNGYWTIEFGRKFNTGHADDIQFDPVSGKNYQFGVSIAGLYGEPVDKAKPHWYGQGRISEKLYLVLK
jgi:hypothetical protein